MSAAFPPSSQFPDSLLSLTRPPGAEATPGPASEGTARPRTRPVVAEWAALVLSLVCIGAFVGWTLVRSHAGVAVAERERLGVQSHVVEDNIAQQIEGVAGALQGVRDEALAQGPGANPAPLSARLRTLADSIPGVRSMVLLDAEGSVVASSVESLVGRDFSDRDYFRLARATRDAQTLRVAPPYRTSLGNYTVVFSLALVAPGGQFQGSVAAALEPAYFEVLMQSVLYAPDMWVSLGHADGKAFVTVPRDAERLETDWQGEFADALRAARGSDRPLIVEGPVGRAPEPRLTALRELQPPRLRMDKPLVIAIGRDRAAAFAAWRHQLLEYVLFFLVLATFAVLALQRAHARRAAFERLAAEAARERRANALQLETALQGADLGLWSLELATDRFTLHAARPSHFGFSAAELADPAFDFRCCADPADARGVQAAIDAHVRGESESFEHELRARTKQGEWRWLQTRGRIVERAGDGTPLRMAGTHHDVTERKAIEARAARSVQLLNRTGELADIGGWELDLATRRLEWTDQVFRIHDLVPGVVPELEDALSFYAPDARPAIAAALEAGARHGTPWDLELPFVTARGVPRWVRAQGVAVVEDGKPVRLQGAFQDITERKTTELEMARLNEQLQRLSTTDALTEVGNRRLFEQALRSEWARAARRREPVGLLMIDIDHFKDYNDHYGHPAGDVCLRRVARLVGEAVRRGGELVARYGGEEFVLLLPGADLDEGRSVAERCLERVAAAKIEHRASGVSAWVTVSIGVASQVAVGGVEPSGLVEMADAALYRAKRCGRNRIEY